MNTTQQIIEAECGKKMQNGAGCSLYIRTSPSTASNPSGPCLKLHLEMLHQATWLEHHRRYHANAFNNKQHITMHMHVTQKMLNSQNGVKYATCLVIMHEYDCPAALIKSVMMHG